MQSTNEIKKTPLLFISSCVHIFLVLVFFFFYQEKNSRHNFKLQYLTKEDPFSSLTSLHPRLSAFQAPVHFLVESAPPPVTIGKEIDNVPAPIKAPMLIETAEKNSVAPDNQPCPLKIPDLVTTNTAASNPKKRTIKEKTNAHLASSRKVTFADIAQGFLESLAAPSSNAFRFLANDTKRNDQKDLRYTSYLQKIVWYLQNSFKQNHTNIPVLRKPFVASFVLTIDKHGEINSLQMIDSTGNKEIDTLLLTSIEEAAPFPPLPLHLKKSMLTIPFYVTSFLGITRWHMAIHQ